MISVQDQPVAGSSPELQRSLHEILGGGIRKSHFAPGILDSSSSSIGSVLTSRSSNLCVDILLVDAFSRRNPTLIWFILNGSGVTVHCMGQSYLLRSSVGIDRNPKRNYKVSDAAPVCRSPFNISNWPFWSYSCLLYFDLDFARMLDQNLGVELDWAAAAWLIIHVSWLVDLQELCLTVADVILWRRKDVTIGILVGALASWVVFEAAGYTLLSLVSNVLLLLICVLFAWAKAAGILNR